MAPKILLYSGRWRYHAVMRRAHPLRRVHAQWAALLLSIAATFVAAAPARAADTWVWTDERGQRVYSDQPPPPSVPPQRILRQPGVRVAPLPAAAPPAAPGVATPQAPPPPAAAKPAEAPARPAPPSPDEDKARQEREATEKRNAQIRADNCQRARAGLATLQAGGRLVTSDAQGRRITMTPEMKAAEQARLEQVARENCR